MNKAVVVAGNGPSLAEIDYRRLPQDFDVYRCNQFYFEDMYFLGKKIKAVFFNPSVFFEQYYTIKQLIERGEYSCDSIYCTKMFYRGENMSTNPMFGFLYPDVVLTYDVIKEYPHIAGMLKYHDTYLRQRPTSGMIMTLIAAMNGYQEIYLTGIDFYENAPYAFNNNKANLRYLIPAFTRANKSNRHTKYIDSKILELIQNEFDISIYALSPSSPLTEFISPPPLSLLPTDTPLFHIEKKPKDCITDILLPDVPKPFVRI